MRHGQHLSGAASLSMDLGYQKFTRQVRNSGQDIASKFGEFGGFHLCTRRVAYILDDLDFGYSQTSL